MATSLTTTYAGKEALPYYSAALLQLNSLSNGAITVKQNIVAKTVVKHGALSNAIKGASCSFSDASTITLTERILDPKNLALETSICKTDFLGDWEVERMGNSAWKSASSTGVMQWLLPQVLADGMAQLETMIWQGVSGASSFDGFETLLTADATVIDELASTVTSANVITELGKVLAASPVAVKTQDDYAIRVSYNVHEAYVAALGGFAAAGVGANGYDNKGTTGYNGEALRYGGKPVIVCNGMSDNTMIAGATSNFWFGTALLSDVQSTIKTVDMEETSLDETVRIKAKFVAGVQYGQGSQIVYYS